LTPFESVKAVILGQDPYINTGEAHGLCFSVKKGIKTPPSLKRMYKEMESCLPDFKTPTHGDLSKWATNGVLMINVTMTVRAKKSNSHKDAGWQTFTDSVMRVLSEKKKKLVYLLWGGFAKKKGKLINANNNIIIETPHPSPLSASKWFGNKCFAIANERLKKAGKEPIDWSVD
jgi:uracil-DNA glycosylase